MTADQARKWIIVSSLFITGVQLVFLLAAPALGFPLEYPKNLDLLQIVMPVFLGYLGSAAHFIFMSPSPVVQVNNQFLGILVKGPILIYASAIAAAIFAFGYSNRVAATPGDGMSVANLGTALSIALGLLAATTGIIVSYLFVSGREHVAARDADEEVNSESGSPKPSMKSP